MKETVKYILLASFFILTSYCGFATTKVDSAARITNFCPGSSYQSLDSIIVSEGSNNDWSEGTNLSYFLVLPTNFEFNNTINVTHSANVTIVSSAISPTLDSIKIVYDLVGSNSSKDSILIKDLQVRAKSGATSADNGFLVRAFSGASDGIMNNNDVGDAIPHFYMEALTPTGPSNIVISADDNTICEGGTVNFTITGAQDTGTSPTYNWEVEGANQGSGVSFSYNSFDNNDEVRLIISPTDGGCYAKTSDTSNVITITETPNVGPSSIVISADDNTICEGGTVNFTITGAQDTGTSPTYNWEVEGANQGSGVSFSYNSFDNNDEVRLIISPTDGGCYAKTSDTSNVITITETPNVGPSSIVISADDNTICEGGTVNFTITGAQDTGTSPTYNWEVEGINQGSGISFSYNSFDNNDEVQLIISPTDGGCYNKTSDTSNVITVTERSTPAQPGAISGSSTYCDNATNSYSISSVVEADSYEWDKYQGGTNITAGGTSLSATFQFSTSSFDTIYVRGYNAECGYGAYQKLRVENRQITSWSNTGAIIDFEDICLGDNANALKINSANVPALATDFLWNTSAGVSIVSDTLGVGSDSIQIDINGLAVANHGPIVTATPTNECGAAITTATYNVQVYALPGSNPIQGESSPACGDTEQYSVLNDNSGAGSSYLWIIPSDVTLNSGGLTSTTLDVSFGTMDSIITVVETNSNGCERENTLTYTQIGCSLNANFNVSQSTSCVGDIVTYSNTTAGASGSASYTWVFGSGAMPDSAFGIGPHKVTYSTSGPKSVQLIVDDAVDDDITQSLLTVNDINSPISIIGDDTPTCLAQGEGYKVSSVTPASTYTWSAPDNSDVINNEGTNFDTISIDYVGDQSGTLTVLETNSAGCNAYYNEGRAIEFQANNSDSQLELPNTFSTFKSSLGSITFWFKRPTTESFASTYEVIFTGSKDSDARGLGNGPPGNGEELNVYINNSYQVGLYIGTVSTVNITSSESFNDNEWHHVGAVWNKSSNYTELYVDGKLVASSTHGAGTFNFSSDVVLGMSADENFSNAYYKGQLDEFTLWEKAIDEEDILSSIYKTATPQSGLLAYYHFDEPLTSTEAIDTSESSTQNNLSIDLTNVTRFDHSGQVPTITSTTPAELTITPEGCGLTAVITASDSEICSGESITFNGLSSSGGLTYEWLFKTNAGITASSTTQTGTGDFTIEFSSTTTITDSVRLIITEGVKDTAYFVYTIHQLPIASVVKVDSVDCKNANTGQVIGTAINGDGNYNYTWYKNGYSITTSTDDTASSLEIGDYNLVVLDGEGCSDTVSTTVYEPDFEITATTSTTPESSPSLDDGEATVTPSGGTPPYAYEWSPDPGDISTKNLATAEGLSAGNYNVTVTDSRGCVKQFLNIAVTEPSAIDPGSILFTTEHPQIDTLCPEEKTKLIGNGGNASGGSSSTITYHWEYSFDLISNKTWTEFPSSTNTLTFDPDTTIVQSMFVQRCAVSGIDTNCTDFVIYEYHDSSAVSLSFSTAKSCENDANVTITGFPLTPAGQFSMSGAVDNGDGTATFDPSIGENDYPVEYLYTNIFGCQSRIVESYRVDAVPVISSFTGLDPLYASGNEIDTLLIGVSSPVMGDYTINFSGDGGSAYLSGVEYVFDPNVPVGFYDVTLSVSDNNTGCSVDSVKTVQVLSSTGRFAEMDNSESGLYCITSLSDTLLLENPGDSIKSVNVVGGGAGITYISADMDSIVFSPAVAGVHENVPIVLEFVYYDSSAVFTVNSVDIYIFDSPEIAFAIGDDALDQDLCEYDTLSDLSISFLPLGGEFRVTTSSALESDMISFNPANGTIGGQDTIWYKVTEDHFPIECEADTFNVINVYSKPNVSISGVNTRYCANDEADTLIGFPTPAEGGQGDWERPTGIYSGFTQLTSDENRVKTLFDNSVAGTTQKIKYSYVDVNECSNVDSIEITIDTLPNVAISNFVTNYCKDTSFTVQGLVGGRSFVLPGESGHFYGDGIYDEFTNDNVALFTANNVNNTDAVNDSVMFEFIDGNGCINSATIDFSVDDVPQVFADPGNLLEDSYCSKDNSVTLVGSQPGNGTGIFRIDNNIRTQLEPSLYNGVKEIIYEFTSSDGAGCSGKDTVEVEIFDSPITNFSYSTICIADSIQFMDETAFSKGLDSVISWKWEFDDNTIADDSTENPKHKYEDGDQYTISLEVVASNGCTGFESRKDFFRENPIADFTWGSECFGIDDIKFSNLSTPDDIDTTKTVWDFGDSFTVDSISNPSHSFAVQQEYDVTLVVGIKEGCFDTVVKTISLRPFVKFDTDNYYFENFETGGNGWEPDDTTSSWELGEIDPTASIINEYAGGEPTEQYAYVTSISSDYGQNENDASLSGPCFSFDNLNKPMISFDYISGIYDQDDGVVIQWNYTDTIGVDSTYEWENIGDIINGSTSGINWYNSQSIDASPGGLSTGWTGMSTNDEGDTTWLEAKHPLDFIKKVPNAHIVRFRVVFASDATTVGPGFGIDNIWIGERERVILLEHFTNNSTACSDCEDYDQQLDAFMETLRDTINVGTTEETVVRDAIDLQYHISTPAVDTFFIQSINDLSSRSSYYSDPDVKTLIMDGNAYVGDIDKLTNEDSLEYQRRTLEDPKFNISMITNYNDATESVDLSVSVRAKEELTDEPITLKVVLVEKEITDMSGVYNTNDGVSYNVVRKLINNPGGLDLQQDWLEGEKKTEYYSYTLNNFYNPGQLGVVAFVQNDITGEVYQTAYTDTTYSITAVKEFYDKYITDLPFIVYPNPANDETNIEFQEGLIGEYTIEVFNNIGQKMLVDEFEHDLTKYVINTSDYANGMYYIRILEAGQPVGERRIIVNH